MANTSVPTFLREFSVLCRKHGHSLEEGLAELQQQLIQSTIVLCKFSACTAIAEPNEPFCKHHITYLKSRDNSAMLDPVNGIVDQRYIPSIGSVQRILKGKETTYKLLNGDEAVFQQHLLKNDTFSLMWNKRSLHGERKMCSEMATRPSWMDMVDAILAGEDEVLSALFSSGAVFHSKAVEMICVREAIHMDSVACLDILLAHGNKYDDYYKDSMLIYAAWHGDATFKWLLSRYTKSDIERLKKDAEYVSEFIPDHVMCLATSRWNYSRTIVSYLHLRDRADLLEYYQHHVGSIAEDYRILIYGYFYRCQVNETLPSRLIRNHMESLRDGKKKITNKSVEILVKNLQSSQSLMVYRLFVEVRSKVKRVFDSDRWHQELRNYIVLSPYVLEEPVTRIAPSHKIVRQPSNGVEIHAPELPHDVLFEIAKYSPWMRMTCHGFYDIEHYRHLFAKEMLKNKEEERDYTRYCLVAAGDINFFDLSLRLYSTVPVITAEWMRLLVLSPVIFMRRLTITKLPLYIRDYHSSSFLLCKVPGRSTEFSVLNVGSSKTLDAIRKRKWWIDKINAEITARFLSTTTTTYNNPNAVTTFLPRIDEMELIDHDSELGKVFRRYKHPLFAIIYLLTCHNGCSLVIPKTFHPEALHPYEIRWLEQFGKV